MSNNRYGYNGTKFNQSKPKSKSKSKYNDMERLAFNMGRVKSQIGKDSKINDSYQNGLKAKRKTAEAKKPMFAD